jgi:hypothetical protein
MGIGVVYHVILRCCFAGGRCPRPPRWSVLPGGAAPGPPAGVFCRVALPPAPPLEGRAALQTTPHGWAFGAIRLGVMPIGADALVSLGGFTDGPKRASALRAPVGAAPGPPRWSVLPGGAAPGSPAGGPCRPPDHPAWVGVRCHAARCHAHWAEAGFGLTCAGGRWLRPSRWRAVPPSPRRCAPPLSRARERGRG